MNRITRILFLVLSLLVLGYLFWTFQAILAYLVVAGVLALMGRPIIKLLGQVHIRQYYLPDAMKAVLTLAVLFGAFSLIFVLFIPPLLKQSNKIQALIQAEFQIEEAQPMAQQPPNTEPSATLPDSIATVNDTLSGGEMTADSTILLPSAASTGTTPSRPQPRILQRLQKPIAYLEDLNQKYLFLGENQTVVAYFRERLKAVLSSIQISNIANSIVAFTGDFIIALFSISFIAFFFLKERTLMHRMVLGLIPPAYEEKVDAVLEKVKVLLSRYFAGVVLEILLVGTLISIGLTILGVENAFVIGFFAGLFNMIPYLGPIIGALLGVIFAVLGALELNFYTEMLPLVLKVMVVFIVIQLVDNFVFQPFIYSSSVKAHPLEIFLVILMAGSLAGIGGMILAIPVYTILRVTAKEFFNQFKLVQSITKDI